MSMRVLGMGIGMGGYGDGPGWTWGWTLKKELFVVAFCGLFSVIS